MCGIFSILNNTSLSESFIYSQFQKGQSRGPESSVLSTVGKGVVFGFHRLSINGLNSKSNQPIKIDTVTLICNGEIFNYKELYDYLDGVKPSTDSDCEVIIHLYLKYGIEHTLTLLDGTFAFLLLDQNLDNEMDKIFVARDPFGVCPLYWLSPNKESSTDSAMYVFASEVKQLTEIYAKRESKPKSLWFFPSSKPAESVESKDPPIRAFSPGTYSSFTLSYKVGSQWKLNIQEKSYFAYRPPNWYPSTETQILVKIKDLLTLAVEKRCRTTERPFACLLSGGLDSSLITALVNQYCIENELPTLETYSIGLEGSTDLKYAKIVAEYLGTKHTEVVMTEAEFCDAIPEVIRAIESYDTTTVRASIGNYLIGKYISKNSTAKVIFNGDGSDELFGGYLYMHHCPNALEFDLETRRLLKNIHQFDLLRSERCISVHGLEPRSPFLDHELAQFYLSISPNTRYRVQIKQEKYLLRSAFDMPQDSALLPACVLWRKKEAFSDGVSDCTRSLHTILKEFSRGQLLKDVADSVTSEPTNDYTSSLDLIGGLKGLHSHLEPCTSEQYYYRKLFEESFPGLGKLVPYFWMPRYVEATDASARTLEIYHK
jgi:asparagine synthase (glutamine-hydrolysing)